MISVEDVEMMSYTVEIMWKYLIIGLGLVLSSQLFNSPGFFIKVLGLSGLNKLLGLTFLIMGSLYLMMFIRSLFGKLVICPKYDINPIEIHVPYSSSIDKLITEVIN